MNMRSSIDAALVSGPVQAPDGLTTFEFRLAPDDMMFAGHFPGRPLVPGALQLEMVRVAAELVLKKRLAVNEITRAKFLRPISPGEPIRLELKLKEKAMQLEARAGFSVHGQPAGEAVLLLREAK